MHLSWLVLGVTFALSIAHTARADDLREPAGGYSIEYWDERRGLPSGRIWAITQDAAGYLWLGTEAGLVRFDGLRFVRWTSNDGRTFPEEAGIFSLWPARDGSLWLGLDSAGVAHIENDRLKYFGPEAGFGFGSVQFVFEDRRGVAWAGTLDALYRFHDARWERAGEALGLPDGGASDAFEDRAGNLWIATRRGVFRRGVDADIFEVVDPLRSGVRLRFSQGADGRLWITDAETGFADLSGSGERRLRSGMSGDGHDVLHDRNGVMWVATRGQGLWRVSPRPSSHELSIQRTTVSEGLSNDIVRALFEDRDGNVWVGTESGLHRFTARKITPLTDIGFTQAVQATPDGSIWIATNNWLVQVNGTTQRMYGEADGLPGPFIRALSTDVHGTLWVATRRGVARRVGERFEQIRIDNLALPRATSIAVDSRGTIWLSDRELGAFVWTGTALKPMPLPPGMSSPNANFVYIDRHDRTWVGVEGGSVAVTEPGGGSRVYSLEAIGPELTAVFEDRSGAIWVGGVRGLGRIYDGRADVVSQPAGLPGFGVFAITEDTDGSLWLGVSSGIVRLSAANFEKAARLPRGQFGYDFYDASDGLAGLPVRVRFPGAARSADGALWFLTSRGANMLRPKDMAEQGAAPSVMIESIRADDEPVSLAPGASLPPGTSRLHFEYTTLNLTSPMKERFRYRLEGVDAEWVDAGARREAFYPNLRSGTYRFQVARLMGDQVASASPTVWQFTIRPMYYETWWFTWGCVAIIGLMAWTAWQLRLRHLRRQFALVFAERARMSRELHDTLLQDLVGITLHFDELATNLETSTRPVASQVVRLRRYLERSIGEARQAVWDLRSVHPDEGSLPAVLRQSGARVFRSRRTEFQMLVTGTPRPCSPATERHLTCIAREALVNAARHADATLVELTLNYQEDAVALHIADNGRGCQPSPCVDDSLGHYGLSIMKERAEQAGGRFHLDTSPDAGTRIEVTVPVSRAS